MFTSTQFLTRTTGIDAGIAAFFVDRRVPYENRYWKGRELYVAGGTGYLFIPLIYDILLRLGVDKKQLLDEAHILRMEGILDSAGKVEFDHFPMELHVRHCIQLAGPVMRNEWLWDSLQEYFIAAGGEPTDRLGLDIPPLNRADTFLFALCDLPMEEDTTRALVRGWYALIGAFLLMDDVVDWEMDEQTGEENSLRFLGEGVQARLKAMDLLRTHFETLHGINPDLAIYFDNLLRKKMKTTYGIR
jgi:hypothetical protein